MKNKMSVEEIEIFLENMRRAYLMSNIENDIIVVVGGAYCMEITKSKKYEYGINGRILGMKVMEVHSMVSIIIVMREDELKGITHGIQRQLIRGLSEMNLVH